MRRNLLCYFAVLFILLTFSACNGQKRGLENKLCIVTTTFPQYDWVRQILGDKAVEIELVLLMDDGIDLHNYQPSVEDIAKISSCDMFIYVGGKSDEWVHKVLETAVNEDMIAVNLLEILGDMAKEEEIVEGMEHNHEADHEHDSSHDDHHEDGLDEHVWLSLKNAQFICAFIGKKLSALDTENADLYIANSEIYNAKLAALDSEYHKMTESASVNTLLFCDRFPFRYLTDDYGLSYYAAFSGCSAETEASFETIVFLAKKLDELSLDNVMVIETSSQSIARTVIASTKNKTRKILVLDSMQSVTVQKINSGTTYLSIAESNLEVLRSALGAAY